MEDGKPKRYANYLFLFHNCSIIRQSADLLKQKIFPFFSLFGSSMLGKIPWIFSFQEIPIKLLYDFSSLLNYLLFP